MKHYAVNNVETDRQKLNAVVPERMLREYWLPHFREAVVEGKACSLMASYNAINGTPNNINHWLLTDVLKDEWGHQGFVVSDLGGVRTMVDGHEKKQMTIEDAVAQVADGGLRFFRQGISGEHSRRRARRQADRGAAGRCVDPRAARALPARRV